MFVKTKKDQLESQAIKKLLFAIAMYTPSMHPSTAQQKSLVKGE